MSNAHDLGRRAAEAARKGRTFDVPVSIGTSAALWAAFEEAFSAVLGRPSTFHSILSTGGFVVR